MVTRCRLGGDKPVSGSMPVLGVYHRCRVGVKEAELHKKHVVQTLFYFLPHLT